MLNSKQRSNLKALASNLSPLWQIGKGGLNDNMVNSLGEALEKRELIKISVLNNAEGDAKIYAEDIAEKLNSEVVAVIGKKIILYRKSSKENFEHIEF